MPSAFLDTNIIIYAATGLRSEPAKANVAIDIIASADFGVSVQVLQEFTVSAPKAAPGFTEEEIDGWIAELLEFDCIPIDIEILAGAIAASRAFRISYWDAAIVVAANTLGAKILYTEDLNHGQVYGGVTVINPFI